MKDLLGQRVLFGLALAALLPLAYSCLKSDEPGLPPDVVKVLQQTGHNKVELVKALAKYVESDDSARRNAMYFLIGNMGRHYAVEYELSDSSGNTLHFDPLQYPDYPTMLRAWDSLTELPGGMIFSPVRYTLDRDTIRSELLLGTVELAFSSKNLPWSPPMPDSIFHRYLLPYRVANEDLENWRPQLQSLFSEILSKSGDSTTDLAARTINLFIDSTLHEDIRLVKTANIALPSKILSEKTASPRDLAIFRVMALRSIGIPATLDYAPWISDSLNTIWFASYYNQEGRWKPLLPKSFDPKLLADSQRVPKIFRRIYHTLDSSLFAIKQTEKTTPPFLGHFHYLDVTSSYLPVRDIIYNGPCPDEFIYLAIWNGRNWKAVDWARCINESARFHHVGRDVSYVFASLEKKDGHSALKLLQDSISTRYDKGILHPK